MILVVGGAGYIGARLVTKLALEGWDVVVVDPAPPGPNLTSLVYRYVRGRIPEALERVPGRPSVVYHLASPLTPTTEDNPLVAGRHVEETVSLIEWAARAGAERVIYASSLAVYGPKTCPCTGPEITEEDPESPETVYGAMKLHAERTGRALEARLGVGFISPRIGVVLGPGRRRGLTSLIVRALEALTAGHDVTVPAPPYTLVHWIHPDDLATLLARLVDYKGKHRVFNLHTARNTLGEILETAASRTGAKIEYQPRPVPLGPRYPVSNSLAARILGPLPSRSINDLVDEIAAAQRPRGVS